MEGTTKSRRRRLSSDAWRGVLQRFSEGGGSAECILPAQGLPPGSGTVLLSDGDQAYAAYAKKTGITNAQCGAHSRRAFFEAMAAEPQKAAEALGRIGKPYEIEAAIRQAKLKGEARPCPSTRTTSSEFRIRFRCARRTGHSAGRRSVPSMPAACRA